MLAGVKFLFDSNDKKPEYMYLPSAQFARRRLFIVLPRKISTRSRALMEAAPPWQAPPSKDLPCFQERIFPLGCPLPLRVCHFHFWHGVVSNACEVAAVARMALRLCGGGLLRLGYPDVYDPDTPSAIFPPSTPTSHLSTSLTTMCVR
jgi:hypothetical protein